MITRITPDAVSRFNWNKYISELKQDFLHMKAGKPLQFIFVYEFNFPKGGTGPLYIMGSNLKAYWQADELKQLQSDYWRTYMWGTSILLEDKKTIELDIKKGGIIKSNKQVIEIAFRQIFRAIGFGNRRIVFKGKQKVHRSPAGSDRPETLVQKVDYVKRKPKELESLKAEAIEAGVFPEKKYKALQFELNLAFRRNNIHSATDWLIQMEELLVNALEQG